MEDPHAVAVEATAFFDIECHEDLELDDLLQMVRQQPSLVF
jgi:hypothetical protein